MPQLIAIARWKDLDRWIPPGPTTPGAWPETEIGTFVKQLDKDRFTPTPDSVVKFCGVRWYGNGVFVREERPAEDVKSACFQLQDGALVYNRLFAWKMAFDLVGAEFADCVVSNEFPQFAIDPSTADPRFVATVCATPSFAERVKEMSTGSTAVSRNRLNEADFVNLTIPLPASVEQQRTLLSELDDVLVESKTLAQKSVDLRSEAWHEFETELGYEPEPPIEVPHIFIAQFAKTGRWDAEGLYRAKLDKGVPESTWPTQPLVQVAPIRLGMQKGPTNRPKDSARPYLRAANVQRNELVLDEVFTIDLPANKVGNLALQDGDLLFVEGSGSRDTIGRCAMWSNEIPDCVHQNSIVRARPDTTKLDPQFAMYWFNSRPGREHFFNIAKTTSGLYHIGSAGVESAPVPVMDLSDQHRLRDKLAEGLAAAEILNEQAAQSRAEAIAQFESAVFG
jgi:type I restriction enzyme S subunit